MTALGAPASHTAASAAAGAGARAMAQQAKHTQLLTTPSAVSRPRPSDLRLYLRQYLHTTKTTQLLKRFFKKLSWLPYTNRFDIFKRSLDLLVCRCCYYVVYRCLIP